MGQADTAAPQEAVINGLCTGFLLMGPEIASHNGSRLTVPFKNISTKIKTDQVTKARTNLCSKFFICLIFHDYLM